MATSSTTSTGAWTNWTTSTAEYTSVSSTGVWEIWSSSTIYFTNATEIYSEPCWTQWVWATELTREQKRAQATQAEINRIEQERLAKEHQEAIHQAELTAQALLQALISEDEMETYLKTGRVLVKGKNHDYILVKGTQADVIKIDKGKVIDLQNYKGKIKGKSYCVHPERQHLLPDTDKIIAMKVALEGNEEAIMKIANPRYDRELDLAVGM